MIDTSETRKQNLRLRTKKINGQPLYNITTVKIFFCLVSKQHPAKPKSTNLRLLSNMQRWRQSDEQKRNTGFRNENKNKRKRCGPSENALQLSEDLKRLSREKKLDKALELYWDKANDGIRDGHHVCIIVDLTARCGLILEGEKLLKKVKEAGTRIGCETKTALMKVRFLFYLE